ncbi:MAG: hypothetical protein K0R99_3766 [Microbacterium sp.]|uniref:DUF4190 domain-containing protein n=1 Tax=Microbacterium sp. TaxID=51671 RepID=UPI002636BABB|nr:DUF4190 domain-containing protein [Microbacterium sp.]MDF2562320.1 hypothetical protein [Microbacterium sp.]
MSDNRIPSPGGEPPLTPPPAPVGSTATPALPANPVGPAPQPPQSHPGAAPTYAPPAYPPYGGQPAAAPQPGYAPPPAQHGYAPPSSPPGYAPPAAQPAYAAPSVQPGYAPPASPSGYGAYPSAGYPAAASRPTNPLAVTSLICGIAGVVLIWAIIPVLASIAAVITGHMALGQIKRQPGVGGRGLAIAGLILGYAVVAIGAFTLVSTVISFLFVGAFTLPFLFSS